MSTYASPVLLKSTFDIASHKDASFSHYLAVAESFPIGSDEWYVAMLHDMLEDGFSIISLYKLLGHFHFGDKSEDIMSSVYMLTRYPTTTNYFNYIEDIADLGGIPLHVKIADIRHHLHRKDTLTPSLEARYRKALRILMASEYHMSLEGYAYAY